MKRTASRIALLIIFTFTCTTVAHAVAPQRTFVSAQQGNDANVAANPPCSATLPCRQFNAAIGAVLVGGEVVALDTGGYGPVAISKTVTLVAPTGVYASIRSQTPGLSAITVTAAGTDTVVLRGLTLVGVGGESGINVSSVGTLHVEGCVISGFAANGIVVSLAADGSHVFVKDTVTRNNGAQGILITTSTGIVRASIDNCRSERNGSDGFIAYNRSRVTVNRSVASGNGSNGFEAVGDVMGGAALMNCEECVSSNNNSGFLAIGVAGGAATMRVSHSTATDNTQYGFIQLASGVFESLVNNLVRGNVAGDTLNTITVVTAK